MKDLRLGFCGVINDDVIQYYGQNLIHLRSISLRGCFLVTKSSWINFFELVGQRLEALEISDTARFDVTVVQALVDFCPKIRCLRLIGITHLDDQCVRLLSGLSHLTELSLAFADGSINDDSIIDLLNNVGAGLLTLDVSGLKNLTDKFLTHGVKPRCVRLKHFLLNDCDLITDDGFVALFDNWTLNNGISTLEVSRCPGIRDNGVMAILQHSGTRLMRLNLNSLDELGPDTMSALSGQNALPHVEYLDISWIRIVDDVVINRIQQNLSALKILLVPNLIHAQFLYARCGGIIALQIAQIFHQNWLSLDGRLTLFDPTNKTYI